jgi:hypothetical protein
MAKLTAEDRNRLPDSDFALQGYGCEAWCKEMKKIFLLISLTYNYDILN